LWYAWGNGYWAFNVTIVYRLILCAILNFKCCMPLLNEKHRVSETGTLGPVIGLTLSYGPNGLGSSLPSSENGNRSSSRNAVFLDLEFWTIDEVQKPGNFESYTPSSESSTFYRGSQFIPWTWSGLWHAFLKPDKGTDMRSPWFVVPNFKVWTCWLILTKGCATGGHSQSYIS
jgi:hypothetical protein